MKRNTQINKLI